jgi:hypothetical protein
MFSNAIKSSNMGSSYQDLLAAGEGGRHKSS